MENACIYITHTNLNGDSPKISNFGTKITFFPTLIEVQACLCLLFRPRGGGGRLVVRVSRIACGVKRVRLFSERLCIYTF